MTPLVSIIITTYNRERFLTQAIESVLQQSYRHLELVLWDDGSTDGSVALAQSYAERDDRVRVIGAAHRGRVPALQAAIAESQGEYLGWLDSDDWLAPTALEETVRLLEARPSVGMVYTDYYDTDELGQQVQYGQRCRTPYSKDRLLVDFMTFQFRLLRRSVYEQVGGVDLSVQYVEDYDLSLRLSEVTQVRHLKRPLYFYRHHGEALNQISRQQPLQLLYWTQVVVQRALLRRDLGDRYALQVDLVSGQFTLHRRPLQLPVLARRIAPLLASMPLAGVLGLQPVQAQSIVPAADGTNTVVNSAGDRFDITGGTFSSNRANLFHSFQQFGLSQGQIANFLANPQIRNILGRVVGGDPSVINGLIQVSGGNANLFLMNPAGIVFGPNASLNVPAAFTATTANGIQLGNNQWFSAVGSNDYANLVGNPSGFAFTLSQSGAIVNAGNLAVGQGQSLTLLGGTVVNTGQLSAPGGQVTIAAVPGQKLVRVSQPGSLLSLEFAPPTPADLAALPAGNLTPASLPALLTGGNLGNATGITANPDGTFQLSGSNLVIPAQAGTTVVSGQVDVSGQTGGTVNLLGRQVGVVNGTINASGLTGGGLIRVGGDYQGQGSVPNAEQTVITNGSVLSADAQGSGNGGRVIAWADQNTLFAGTITARGGAASGDGGLVEVSGKQKLSFLGTVDTSAANGKMGTLLLDPADILITADTTPGSFVGNPSGVTGQVLFGDVGPTTITQGQLQSLPGTTNVVVQATNGITFQPLAGGELQFLAGPGSIRFEAGNFILMQNLTDTIATNGRNISFQAGSLTLGNIDATPQFSFSSQNGGDITLKASGNIETGNLISTGFGYFGGEPIPRGGTITVESSNGSITVGDINTRASIPSESSLTIAGGDVKLTTGSNGGNIVFRSIDTRANTEFFSTAAAGGNVTIDAHGMVRGTNVIPFLPGVTIATGGVAGGSDGVIQITHDGGPANIPFKVGDGGITAGSGNGTVGSLNAEGSEVINSQSFPFSSSPFSSPLGRIQITFRNTTPTLSAISTLPSVQLQPVTTIKFSTADLQLKPADANADNTFIRIAAIAPGASLKINGQLAAPGDLLPPAANLEFTAPAKFVGLLKAAFSLQIDDQISTSPPVDIAVEVVPPKANSCVLPSSCNNTPPNYQPPPLPYQAASINLLTTPDQTFSQEYESFLGLPPSPPKSIEEQQQIARDIEKETGAKPAFLYFSFVPPDLQAQQALQNQILNASSTDLTRAKDQLEIIVITGQGEPIRKRIPEATRARMLEIAQRFRLEVADPRKTRTTSYLKWAQQLYQWMIAPIQEELLARGITNLVFIMDEGLRSLPVAALHNGQSFLVQTYSLGVMPSLSLTDTRYQDIRNAKLLGMGISESTQGQPPLPSVPVELSTLVNNIWPGRYLLNSEATLNNLEGARQTQPFGVVHLATHADFSPGVISNSYIQLWNDKLRLNQVPQLGWNNPQVQLLVLSACVTALGNREAELGFGGLAVQSGVKTALASLWYVSDAATTGLMARFYQDLQSDKVKAEALRRAQIAMIKGEIVLEDGKLTGPGLPQPIQLPPDATSGRDRILSHPYYWAAFTIIGSPW
jgi:filamentous hemagglutinin family protein